MELVPFVDPAVMAAFAPASAPSDTTDPEVVDAEITDSRWADATATAGNEYRY